MKFYNYINEVISTTKIEKIVDTYMGNIEQKFRDSAGTINKKNAGNVIKKEVIKALKEIFYDLYGIDKINKLKVSIRKKQKSSRYNAQASYYSISSMGADAVTFEIEIEIGENIIKYAMYDSKKRSMIFNELGEILTHEIVHIIQAYRSNWKNGKKKPYYSSGRKATINIKDTEGFKAYLSLPEEISAYASEAAMMVVRYKDKEGFKISPNKLIKDIHKKRVLEVLSDINDIFGQYYEYFGKNKENKASQKVWKKFIKEFTHHLKERMDND